MEINRTIFLWVLGVAAYHKI